MFYEKNFKGVKTVKKKVSLKSFQNSLTENLADGVGGFFDQKYSYNFCSKNGSLQKGIGFNEVFPNIFESLKIIPKTLYFYRFFDKLSCKNDDRIVVYASDKKLYQIFLKRNNEVKEIIGSNFEISPKCESYNFQGLDTLLFGSDTGDTFILKDETLTLIPDAPKITSLCVHSERLFVTAKNELQTVWFSDDFNPENWSVSLTEAGFIELTGSGGKPLKLIEFLDYVFVFRDYGITRITAFGDQTEFSVDNVYNSSSKIYEKSIIRCGEYIVFACEDGLYRFNGLDTVKILNGIDFNLLQTEENFYSGTFINNTLYMLTKGKIDGKTLKNLILVYDFNYKTAYFVSGIPLEELCRISGEENFVLGVSGSKILKLDDSGTVNSKPLEKVWKSVESDFGLQTSKKRLYKVNLSTKERIKLLITVDGKVNVYNLRENEKEIFPDLKGDKFSIEIISNSFNPEIKLPTLYFSYFSGDLW